MDHSFSGEQLGVGVDEEGHVILDLPGEDGCYIFTPEQAKLFGLALIEQGIIAEFHEAKNGIYIEEGTKGN